MITIDRDMFFSNLKITQRYCEQQLQQSGKPDWAILRSSTVFGISAYTIPWEEWNKKVNPYNVEAFAELFQEQLAYKKQLVAGLKQAVVPQGKILVIEYGLNIPDGAVEEETGGFFDGFDLPSIDTWFYNDCSKPHGGILFAWIPTQFIELTDSASALQFLSILHWFEKPTAWPQ